MAENGFSGHSRGTCNSTIRAKQMIKEKWQRSFESLVIHCDSKSCKSHMETNNGESIESKQTTKSFTFKPRVITSQTLLNFKKTGGLAQWEPMIAFY